MLALNSTEKHLPHKQTLEPTGALCEWKGLSINEGNWQNLPTNSPHVLIWEIIVLDRNVGARGH